MAGVIFNERFSEVLTYFRAYLFIQKRTGQRNRGFCVCGEGKFIQTDLAVITTNHARPIMAINLESGIIFYSLWKQQPAIFSKWVKNHFFNIYLLFSHPALLQYLFSIVSTISFEQLCLLFQLIFTSVLCRCAGYNSSVLLYSL